MLIHIFHFFGSTIKLFHKVTALPTIILEEKAHKRTGNFLFLYMNIVL